MKLYVAANDRWAAIHFACILIINHHKVTSNWHNVDFVRTKDLTRADRQEIAERCLNEVHEADALVLIATEGMVPGGKFVEVGAALGSNKRVYVVGRRENLMMYHPYIIEVKDPTDLLERIKGR